MAATVMHVDDKDGDDGCEGEKEDHGFKVLGWEWKEDG